MKRKLLLLLLCVVFLVMTGYFGVRLYNTWSEYKKGEEAYASLSQYVQLETAPAEKPTEPVPKEEPKAEPTQEPEQETVPPTKEPDPINWPVVDFEALHEINPQVVAWLYIEGTSINYPVMQGTDNHYYLDRLIDGTYNWVGSLFMDYRNDPALTDKNTVIYGHHMRNGTTMFADVAKYTDQVYYDEHPVCLVITPDGNYTLEFFAGYVTDMNTQAWKLEFGSDEEFKIWTEDAIARSTFKAEVTPEPEDRVMTFSTCSYEFSDARYVLLGILKEH